jgi:hypothetical protein
MIGMGCYLGHWFPATKVRRGPALVQFDKIESRNALRLAVAKIRFLKQFREPRTRRVAPSGLLHEAVEDFDFSIMWSTPICEAPFENFLIRPTSEYAVLHVRIPEMQEGKAVAVELTPQILMISLGKDTLRMETNLWNMRGRKTSPPTVS